MLQLHKHLFQRRAFELEEAFGPGNKIIGIHQAYLPFPGAGVVGEHLLGSNAAALTLFESGDIHRTRHQHDRLFFIVGIDVESGTQNPDLHVRCLHDKGTVDVARDIQIGLATEFHPAFALGPLADFQFRSGIEPYDRTVGKHRFGLLTDRRGERSELQVRRRIIPEIFGEIRDACNESNDCRCCKPLPVTAEFCPALRHCNVIIHE